VQGNLLGGYYVLFFRHLFPSDDIKGISNKKLLPVFRHGKKIRRLPSNDFKGISKKTLASAGVFVI
jgi:hypothetical protein